MAVTTTLTVPSVSVTESLRTRSAVVPTTSKRWVSDQLAGGPRADPLRTVRSKRRFTTPGTKSLLVR